MVAAIDRVAGVLEFAPATIRRRAICFGQCFAASLLGRYARSLWTLGWDADQLHLLSGPGTGPHIATGATGSSYTLVSADTVGKQIACVVTATNVTGFDQLHRLRRK